MALAGMKTLLPNFCQKCKPHDDPVAGCTPQRSAVREDDAIGKKRARQLDFEATEAQGSRDDAAGKLSPSSAAGTLLGFAGAVWYRETASPGPKRKACNCKNSKCLKLYCECFASGVLCSPTCNCVSCHNDDLHQAERKSAIDATLERNPMAFRPKIAPGAAPGLEDSPVKGRHTKGCHCRKSGCLKKYCECFQAGVMCGPACKCHECRNTLDSAERRALLTAGPAPSGTPSPTSKPAPHRSSSASASARGRPRPAPWGNNPAALLAGAMPRGGSGAVAGELQAALAGLRGLRRGNRDGASSHGGLPQVAPAQLPERALLRRHLSDPVLFNLCRVFLLGAKNAAKSHSGESGAEAAGQRVKSAMAEGVVRELGHYLRQMRDIVEAKPARNGAGAEAGGKSDEQKEDDPIEAEQAATSSAEQGRKGQRVKKARGN